MNPVWVLRWLPTALLGILLTAGVIFGIHYFREQGRDEYRKKVQDLESQLAMEKDARALAEKVTMAYYEELDRLNRRPVSSTPVRLCGTVPKMPTVVTAPRFDDTTSRAGSDDRPAGGDLEAGPDIGPELYGLAKTCDAEIAKLRALQGWINDVR